MSTKENIIQPGKLETRTKIITTKISMKRSRIPRKYRIETLSITSSSFSLFNTNHICAICLNEISFSDRHFLHCGHCFHCSCINTWLGDNHSCPYCKQEANGTCSTSATNSSNPNLLGLEIDGMIFSPDDILNPPVPGDIMDDIVLILLIGLCFAISIMKLMVIKSSL